MNYRMVLYVLGRIFLVEAGLLLIPLGCALLYGEDTLLAFLIPMAILALLGCAFGLRRPKNTTIYARDGLVVAALAWVLLSAFGALPFLSPGRSLLIPTPFSKWSPALPPPAPPSSPTWNP